MMMHAQRSFALLLLATCLTSTMTHASYLRGGSAGVGVAQGVGGVGGSEFNLQSVLASTPPPTPASSSSESTRDLKGALNNKEGSIQANMPARSPNTGLGVGTPPLQTLQGQALGPTELPVLLPFASPYVSTP